MKLYWRLYFLLFVFWIVASSHQAISQIVGTIIDGRTGEILVNTNISIIGTSLCTISDTNGKYSFHNVPSGVYSLKASMIGFESDTIKSITVVSNKIDTLDVRLYRCGTKQALDDISHGKVQVVLAGLNIRVLPKDILIKLTEKYGFIYVYDDIVGACFYGYSETVNEYLDKLNGKGWQTQFQQERDSLLQKYNQSNHINK